MVVLPSGRLLQMYKNSCSKNPGFNESVGEWMVQEAIKRKIAQRVKKEVLYWMKWQYRSVFDYALKYVGRCGYCNVTLHFKKIACQILS